MTYQEAESYLLEIPRFTRKNSREDTRAFLQKLGEPAGNRRIIHVAGTNGKGSVCAYLASVLQKGGYRTGMFTSPHLVTMRERFRIDGESISEEQFLHCFCRVQQAVEQGLAEGGTYRPTFFEMLFFMAMVCFEEQAVDVLILETGLGGRLDATNSVSRKDLCILTEIGLDHMEQLGSTIAQIAGEKAGILQKNVPVVYADRCPEASRVIERQAKLLSAPAFPVSNPDIRNLEFHKNFIDFSYDTGYYGYVRCSLASCAPYQAENAALALRGLAVLAEQLPLTEQALQEGLSEARWEGRMEEILPDVYVDGAHNADGIRAFLEAVRGQKNTGRRLLLFSAVQEKQYQEMIRLLCTSDIFDQIYLTEINNTRGLSLQNLKETFLSALAEVQMPAAGRMAEIVCIPRVGAAIESMLERQQPGDVIYAAGSLYLVGEIKGRIAGRAMGK